MLPKERRGNQDEKGPYFSVEHRIPRPAELESDSPCRLMIRSSLPIGIYVSSKSGTPNSSPQNFPVYLSTTTLALQENHRAVATTQLHPILLQSVSV